MGIGGSKSLISGETHPFFFGSLLSWNSALVQLGLLGGAVSVDWIDKTFRFGIGLKGKEVKAVVKSLNHIYQETKSSNNMSTPNKSFDRSAQSKFEGYLSIRPSTDSPALVLMARLRQRAAWMALLDFGKWRQIKRFVHLERDPIRGMIWAKSLTGSGR